jgi:hypothetical protein
MLATQRLTIRPDSAGNPVTLGSTNPRYWTARFTNNDTPSIAFALCVPN